MTTEQLRTNRNRSQQNSDNGICEGGCEEHIGRRRVVRVIDSSCQLDWGLYSYCEYAIKLDRSRGFEVQEKTQYEELE